MSTSFSRAMRALEADGFSASNLRLALVGLLLVAWVLWFWLARILEGKQEFSKASALYERSKAALPDRASKISTSAAGRGGTSPVRIPPPARSSRSGPTIGVGLSPSQR